MEEQQHEPAGGRFLRFIKSLSRFTVYLTAAPVVLILGLVGTLIIFYSNLPTSLLRSIGAAAFAVGSILTLVRAWRRLRVFLWWSGAFVLVVVWFLLIPASNDRDWKPEVAVLADALIDGDLVTIKNIRNFDYRSATDFDIRYYDKTFDLSKLDKVFFIVSYWGEVKDIAHTFVSFGFSDEEFLAISIEIRPEVGENYNPLKGLFKQFEIIYVVADERDVIRVRTNYRDEHLYLYEFVAKPEAVRALFLDMLEEVQALNTEPRYYKTINRNCTTSLVRHIDHITPKPIPFHREVLLNGYSDKLAYNSGLIQSDLSFDEMKPHHLVSKVAQAHDQDPEFSKAIRRHLE